MNSSGHRNTDQSVKNSNDRSKQETQQDTHERETAERARYVELAFQGLSNDEISSMLGISRHTGTKG